MLWDTLNTIDPNTAAAQSLFAAALGGYTVVRVSGQDASDFLQGQFCNDVASLSENGVQLNGYCSPKGRLLAIFHLMKSDGGYLMLLPSSEVERVTKRLNMFVLRADVKFESDPSVSVLALRGEELVGSAVSDIVPDHDGAGLIARGVHSVRLRDDVTSIIAIGSPVALNAVLETFDDAAACGENGWRTTRMQSGEPALRDAAVERFVPQMLNMDLIDGLSFSKGCYPGQEIVARTKYLGKQKRRLMRWTGTGVTAAPAPASSLVTADGENAAEVLESLTTDGVCTVLAVLRLEHLNQPLYDAEGAEFAPADLPYDPLVGTD